MMDWPEGYDRQVLGTVDSTMLEAARQAPHLSGPTWICARHQSAARGRRGRVWENPQGNFSATLVLPTREEPQLRALRSFVAALALFDALVALTGRADALALKWPNDVLLAGGKVAGILLESLGDHLAIGIGVNLLDAPSGAEVEPGAVRPVSVLSVTGCEIGVEAFLAALASSYAAQEATFAAFGFDPIREAWLARAARRGEEVTARMGDREVSGIFETVDAEGRMVLRTGAGRQAIAAAEIFF
ncbi:biotin--[acetyl-CoA-carboxylase] ligase [Marivita sp. GX14005]|uniref:biotin--[acetyl-CoA-carboxylase] ligase n=1 Tax=Marivita sp. GX14005 TaxID=2942276 RepID=UPI00201A1DE7|nr:biotin--[acetyl-CoA-carboxylase] ligase [Marivita sp. GX14005]MCL3882747.1 biotin--[acetyl-CoA-carboxylase] ligase [Marivita sp. GX14005]